MAQRVPITGEAGLGYLLLAEYNTPPLMLTPAELEALVLGVLKLKLKLNLTRFGGAPQAFAGGFIDAPHSSALLA